MADFLDKADRMHRQRPPTIRGAEDAFRDVLKAVSEMRAIYAKSYLDLDNIEVVLGAIEMAQLIGKLGDRNESDIAKLRASITTVIVKTLEETIAFPVVDGEVRPPSPYDSFINHLALARQTTGGLDAHQFAFMTFNYDVALDYALHWSSFAYDYCLGTKDDGFASPYLKLHGSTNWGVCQRCQRTVPFPVGEAQFPLKSRAKSVRFDLGSKLAMKECCGLPLGGPLLVPPTWNKTAYPQLASVWKRAARELSLAENIVVIGYSLPESDAFFRYLFALGTESSARIRTLLVIDPDPDGFVEKRFRDFIARAIQNRFRFVRKNFEGGLEEILSLL